MGVSDPVRVRWDNARPAGVFPQIAAPKGLARPRRRGQARGRGGAPMKKSDQLWDIVDGKRMAYVALADRVWETPELAYTEARSSAAHRELLEAQGFRVTERLAGIPTAVMGEAGEGGPVIAILGEYDALPGLSQEGRHRRAAARWVQAATACCGTTCWARRRCWRRRGEGLAGGERAAGPRALLRLPGRGRRRRQGASWCATGSSTTSTSPSPGIRPASSGVDGGWVPRQHARSTSPSRPRLACRGARRISAAARSTRSS